MEENIIAFMIWIMVGVFFIGMGIYDLNSRKEKTFVFWANAETVLTI